MYDIRSGYLQDGAIHSSPYTRKDDEVRRCFQLRLDVSNFRCTAVIHNHSVPFLTYLYEDVFNRKLFSFFNNCDVNIAIYKLSLN